MAGSPYALSGQQLSTELDQQAAAHQLGTWSRSYKPKFASALLILLLTLGIIIADIVVMVAIVYLTNRLVIYLLAVPIITVIWAVRTLPHSNLKVHIFASGLIYSKGRSYEVVRWEQIDAIWQSVTRGYRGTNYVYTVQRSDGKTFKFTNALVGVTTLGSTLQQEVVRVHLPKAIAAFNAGSTLEFGKINVTAQGMNNGKEIIPWDQVGSVVVNQGIVGVNKNGRLLKWSSVKAANVPNLLVLINLVDYIVKQRAN